MKVRRSLLCIMVCAVMAVCMSLSIYAESFSVNGATVTYNLYVYDDHCQATTSINKSDVSTAVTATIVGTYVLNGVYTTKATNSSGSTGTTATLYIDEGTGTWTSITSTHYGKYAGSSDTKTLSYTK